MSSILKLIEAVLWCCGLLMVAVFLGQIGIQEIGRMNAVAAFKTDQVAVPPAIVSQLPGEEFPADVPARDESGGIGTIDYVPAQPDQSLWSSGRIASFAASLSQNASPVLGVFEIPRFDLELPIYNGATDLHMDRGIGRIDGTAMVGHESGNLGIAGHRDGYFRVLKDIKFGDEIVVTSANGPQVYVVEQLMIVEPSAVEVLRPTPKASITLVTCYPFYFVGHAPERFIVRAVLKEQKQDMRGEH